MWALGLGLVTLGVWHAITSPTLALMVGGLASMTGASIAGDRWHGAALLLGAATAGVYGALVLLQGLAEMCRCVICLRTGAWPARLKDAEEIDVVEQQLAASTHIDEEARQLAAQAQKIDEAAHRRIGGGQ